MTESNEPSQPFPFLQRSPLLLDVARSCLIVIDVQEKLFPMIHGRSEIELALRAAMDGARLFDVPIFVSEQYPEKLGPSIETIRSGLLPSATKRMFSCRECAVRWQEHLPASRDTLILCGIETHVCVQQTALDFIAAGWNVVVLADAVGARRPIDHGIAIERMRWNGCTISTVEAALFEWCETSTSPKFRELSQIIKSRQI